MAAAAGKQLVAAVHVLCVCTAARGEIPSFPPQPSPIALSCGVIIMVCLSEVIALMELGEPSSLLDDENSNKCTAYDEECLL